MSVQQGVRRQYVSDGYPNCSKCHRNIRAGDVVDSLPPTRDRSLSWRDGRCHPSCDEAKARRDAGLPPANLPPPPATRFFANEFESTVCFHFNCYIKVGDRMSAVVGTGQNPKWQQKKHEPGCPPDATPADRGGGGG